DRYEVAPAVAAPQEALGLAPEDPEVDGLRVVGRHGERNRQIGRKTRQPGDPGQRGPLVPAVPAAEALPAERPRIETPGLARGLDEDDLSAEGAGRAPEGTVVRGGAQKQAGSDRDPRGLAYRGPPPADPRAPLSSNPHALRFRHETSLSPGTLAFRPLLRPAAGGVKASGTSPGSGTLSGQGTG